MERVRLLMHAGEVLEAPSVEHLRTAANHLVVAASTAKAGTRATTSETAGAVPSAPSHLQLQPVGSVATPIAWSAGSQRCPSCLHWELPSAEYLVACPANSICFPINIQEPRVFFGSSTEYASSMRDALS